MKYFKTRHEKNSARLTALIAVILLLLLFVVGTKYMDPPEEYGVAVNFGNSDFGKGKVQPLKPVKSEPRKIEEPPQPDVSKSEPTQTVLFEMASIIFILSFTTTWNMLLVALNPQLLVITDL